MAQPFTREYFVEKGREGGNKTKRTQSENHYVEMAKKSAKVRRKKRL